MPANRPRHPVTETPAVAHAPDVAARHWPGEARSKLLVRLVRTGGEALEREHDEAVRGRETAIAVSSGAFAEDHLAILHQDWPE